MQWLRPTEHSALFRAMKCLLSITCETYAIGNGCGRGDHRFAVRGVALAHLGHCQILQQRRTRQLFRSDLGSEIRFKSSRRSCRTSVARSLYRKFGRSASGRGRGRHKKTAIRHAALGGPPQSKTQKLLPAPPQRTQTIADAAAVQHAASSITMPASAALVRHTQPWLHAEYSTQTESCTRKTPLGKMQGKPDIFWALNGSTLGTARKR